MNNVNDSVYLSKAGAIPKIIFPFKLIYEIIDIFFGINDLSF